MFLCRLVRSSHHFIPYYSAVCLTHTLSCANIFLSDYTYALTHFRPPHLAFVSIMHSVSVFCQLSCRTSFDHFIYDFAPTRTPHLYVRAHSEHAQHVRMMLSVHHTAYPPMQYRQLHSLCLTPLHLSSSRVFPFACTYYLLSARAYVTQIVPGDIWRSQPGGRSDGRYGLRAAAPS